jgi:hypothetical protein
MEISESKIKELVSSVLEESRAEVEEILRNHLREGDEDTDDDSDGGDDDPGAGADDLGGGDDFGGGDDGGDGGDSDSADSEKEIDKMSDKVSHGFDAPKNLTLNDGTQTHVAVDSEDQIGEVDQD